MMLKRFVLCILVIAFLFIGINQALAVPTLGGQLYATGGNVVITVEPASAGYTSELWLYDPTNIFVATNRDTGTTVNLGSFTAGIELIFGIYVRDTEDIFKLGPGDRNPDGIAHGMVDFRPDGTAMVGFEDLYGGGDRDFNDNMFLYVSGVGPNHNVPEPSTMLLFGAGLAGLGIIRKRFKV